MASLTRPQHSIEQSANEDVSSPQSLPQNAAKAGFISLPASGATLNAGQNFTVQVLGGNPTSASVGLDQVSLVIGIVGCGTSPCPAASADLGEVLFIGKFQPQGAISGTLVPFENFSFVPPSDISGSASIQAQLITLMTPPGHAIPDIEYQSVEVQVL